MHTKYESYKDWQLHYELRRLSNAHQLLIGKKPDSLFPLVEDEARAQEVMAQISHVCAELAKRGF